MAQSVASSDLHRVVAVCFVYRQVKHYIQFLIIKRHPSALQYPNLWTVPGGGLESADYEHKSFDNSDTWEAPLEDTARRELQQEAGIQVGQLYYQSSFRFIRSDGVPVLGVRFAARYVSGEVRLDPEDATEFVWAHVSDLYKYKFLGNIGAEIENIRKNLR